MDAELSKLMMDFHDWHTRFNNHRRAKRQQCPTFYFYSNAGLKAEALKLELQNLAQSEAANINPS